MPGLNFLKQLVKDACSRKWSGFPVLLKSLRNRRWCKNRRNRAAPAVEIGDKVKERCCGLPRISLSRRTRHDSDNEHSYQ